MNNIVLYESNTGFTARYAGWIARALPCESRPLKGLSKEETAKYDRVIFDGWVMGNGIAGLDKLRALTSPAVVFAVGSTPPYDEVIAAIKEQNKLGELPFFYMQGGFAFEELGLPLRLLLKGLKKSVAKKQGRSRQEEFMAGAFGASFDSASEEQAGPLIEYVRAL